MMLPTLMGHERDQRKQPQHCWGCSRNREVSPLPPGLIYHSDRGSQYTSHLYQAALQKGGMQPRMGKKGDCFDNAVVELFFSTLIRELMLGTVFVSRQEGRSQVFEYLEIFYNRQRRHSTLRYLMPVEFEQRGNRAVA